MSNLFRIVSFAMMFVVAGPMVRDCCLPLTNLPPCHHSKHTDDLTCASNLQAITENKTTYVLRVSVPSCDLPVAPPAGGAVSAMTSQASEQTTASLPPPIELYLRTRALLI